MGPTVWTLRNGRIRVETLIRAPFEAVWAYTQTPELHARWDARFSSIEYLPKPADEVPQRFRYSRRVIPGLTIRGTGETVGTRFGPDGSATSALTFRSGHPLSLIRRGSGYWRYLPEADGVRFLTEYDYEANWGPLGRIIDRVAFRPALAWLTAWSFDRLRRWLEAGTSP